LINALSFPSWLKMAIDPVCGMEVDPDETEFKTEYMGKTFYFCNERCMEAFEKRPKFYIK
jgi:YHS domain-containing protein